MKTSVHFWPGSAIAPGVALRYPPGMAEPSPPSALAAAPERLRARAAALLREVGLAGLAMVNRRRVARGVWRSGQPGPAQLRAFARTGGRAVVSLRAGEAVSSLPAEIAACRALGLAFHRLPLRGHRLPGRDELRTARRVFAGVERPVLLHCQSGADRAGLAAALWLLFEGRSLAEARRQLSPRYGHNPLGRAGLLDAFLDAYAASRLPFETWLETAYEPERIAQAWHATGVADRLRLWRARR